MDKTTETRTDTNRSDTYVQRHLSQLKLLTRLVEHQLEQSNEADVRIERELVENMLDTLEIFIEDLDGERPVVAAAGAARAAKAAPEKPSVTRLN